MNQLETVTIPWAGVHTRAPPWNTCEQSLPLQESLASGIPSEPVAAPAAVHTSRYSPYTATTPFDGEPDSTPPSNDCMHVTEEHDKSDMGAPNGPRPEARACHG